MNENELKNLLNDPQRVLNIIRVFHQLLHQMDKMEEEKTKLQKPGSAQNTKLKDNLDIVVRDKDGNIKTRFNSNMPNTSSN